MSTLARDYRHVDTVGRDAAVAKYAPRSSVHITENIHLDILFLYGLGFIWIAAIVGNFFPSLDDSPYFRFGRPIVAGKELRGEAEFWFLLSVFFVDRVFARIGSEVTPQWKHNLTYGADRNLGGALALTAFDLLLHWVRNAVLIIFLYSQISFAFAFALGDMLGHFIIYTGLPPLIEGKIPHYLELRRRHDAGEKNIDPTKYGHGWFVTTLVLNIAGVGLLMGTFAASGFFKTDYFSVGPPVAIFSREVTGDTTYWLTVAYVFCDQLWSSYANGGFGPWIYGKLYNNGVYNLAETTREVYTYYYIHRVVVWLRAIVVLNLTMTQVVFTLTFFAAELVYAVVHVVLEFRTQGAAVRSLVGAVFVRVIQGIGLVIYATTVQIWLFEPIFDPDTGDKLDIRGYFDFPPPFVLAGHLFTSEGLFTLILLYAMYERVPATLSGELIAPMLMHVVEGGDINGIRYSPGAVYIIAWLDNLAQWVRNTTTTHFAISNFYFSFFTMLVDLLVSGVVLARYLRYKTTERAVALDYDTGHKRAVLQAAPSADDDDGMMWTPEMRAKDYAKQHPFAATNSHFRYRLD